MGRSLQGSLAAGLEQRRRFVLMLYSRAAVVTTLLGSTIFFNLRSGRLWFSTTQILLYSVVLAVYLMTAGYLVWIRVAGKDLGFQVQLQAVIDVLLATSLVYVTGSVESPFTFFYALPVITIAVFFPRRGPFLTAGLGCLFLSALFILENQGILSVELEGRLRMPPPAGRVVYLLALNYAVFFAIAWLAGYLGKQLQQTGRELEKKRSDLETLAVLNRDIVLSLRSGLLVIDQLGKVSLLNPVAEQILGSRGGEVLGLPASEVFPSLASLPALAGQPAGEPCHRLEVEHFRKADGKRIPVGLTLSTLRSPEGEAAGTLVHLQDLTERRKMEASVKRAEKLAALGAMAAGIAHEIRNPLASISGAVQVIKDLEDLSDQDRRLIEIILRETKRLDMLLANFLGYAKPREPQPRKCSLDQLVEETVAVFLHSASEEGPEVVAELERITARVDPDQLRQVLWNLLTNAAQAVDGTGRVTIRLAEGRGNGDRQVVLEVEDNGPGVPPELRERIFEPFFTTREEGSGLGLATVSRIVEAHGGSVGYQSPVAGGSRFVIRLPGVIDERDLGSG